MKTKYLIIIMMSIFSLFSGGCSGSRKDVPPMTAGSVLIDVRSPEEYNVGHLAGAKLMPHDKIADLIVTAVPEKDTPLYLYCRSGRRVGIAIKTLKGLGYTVMYDLGGMEDARKTLGLPAE